MPASVATMEWKALVLTMSMVLVLSQLFPAVIFSQDL